MGILFFIIAALLGYRIVKKETEKQKLIRTYVAVGLGILTATVISVFIIGLPKDSQKIMLVDIWLAYGVFIFVSSDGFKLTKK